MILIGLGANLASERFGGPVDGCETAIKLLKDTGIGVPRCSYWYRSAPLPPADQADYVNGVAEVETRLGPADLLAGLHEIERAMGRIRGVANAARVIDIDLIDYEGLALSVPDGPVLPHPRLQDRAFVLLPLREVAPHWRHPVLGTSVDDLIRDLPPGQDCVLIDPSS